MVIRLFVLLVLGTASVIAFPIHFVISIIRKIF